MSIEDKAKDILLKMGLWWPDANSGTLRSAATAWRTFAESVDDVRGPTNSTARSLIHHNKGESIEAFDKFWSQYAKGKDAGWLGDLADSARAMAKFLEKFADAIDAAIHKLWEHIAIDAAVIAAGSLSPSSPQVSPPEQPRRPRTPSSNSAPRSVSPCPPRSQRSRLRP
ncbi:hypothetical protein ACFQ51_31165 [Streptomyces kaempferi]